MNLFTGQVSVISALLILGMGINFGIALGIVIGIYSKDIKHEKHEKHNNNK